jgi:hypothetical protein
MGCVFCNITNVDVFPMGTDPGVANPFYCKTSEERAEFINELCADIVARHPEVVKRLIYYAGLALAISFKKRLRSLWPFGDVRE